MSTKTIRLALSFSFPCADTFSDVVGRFACLRDPCELYRAGQPSREGYGVKTRQKSAPGPPGWGLGVVPTIPPRKNQFVTEMTTNATATVDPIADLSNLTGRMTTSDKSPRVVRSATDSLLDRA